MSGESRYLGGRNAAVAAAAPHQFRRVRGASFHAACDGHRIFDGVVAAVDATGALSGFPVARIIPRLSMYFWSRGSSVVTDVVRTGISHVLRSAYDTLCHVLSVIICTWRSVRQEHAIVVL